MSANGTYELETKESKEELKPKQNENIDIIDTVLNYVGDFGRYQKFLMLFLLPFGMIASFVYFVQIFITATPKNYWCWVPELQDLDQGLRRNLTAPPGGDEGWAWDRCRTYDVNWTQVLQSLTPPPPNTKTVACSHGWEFQLDDIPFHTVVSERGWVCDRATYAPSAQAFFFLGSIVGAIFFGWLADRYGRVPALVGSNMIAFVGSIAGTFTKGFWDFTFTRILVGMGYDNCYFLMYIIVMEYVGPKYRTWAANLSMALCFGGSAVALPWIALWISNWRILLVVTALPMLLSLFVPFVVPESTRWLTSSGKIKRMLKTIKRFEKVNRTTVPQDVLDDLVTSSRKANETDESITAFLKSKPLRLMMIALVTMFTACAVVFDGLVRVSGNLGFDFFISFTLSAFTEIPSLILLAFILDKFGRRKLTFIPLVTAGVLCLTTIFVPKGVPKVALAIMARFCTNMGTSTIVQWAAEVMPTPVRASASSLVHITAFFGVAVSPFIIYSERIWYGLPLVLQGIMALVAAGFSLLLPEMMGRPLPQNIAEGERLFNENSFCGKPEYDVDDIEKEKKMLNKETR